MNMEMLFHILFGISLGSVCIILLLSVMAARRDNFQFLTAAFQKKLAI